MKDSQKQLLAWCAALVLCVPLIAAAQAQPTLTTDKPDYSPGEVVTLTGTGFAPGETVQISIICGHGPVMLFSVADAAGGFINRDYIIQFTDLNQTLTATATGQTSGLSAQVVFTDGPTVGPPTISAQSPSPVLQGGVATYNIFVNGRANSPGGFQVGLSFLATPALPNLPFPPAGTTPTFTPSFVTFPPCPPGAGPTDPCRRQPATLTVQTSGATPTGVTSHVLVASRLGMPAGTSDQDAAVFSFNVAPGCTNFTTAISGAPLAGILLGSSISLTANNSGGNAPFSYAWTRAGSPFGSNSANQNDTPALGATQYGVTVTDAGGCTATATAGVNVYDFTVTLSTDQTTLRGTPTGNYTVTVTTTGTGAPASIPLSLAGLPVDATAAGFPASLAPNSSANFTVQTGNTSLGDFTLTATGTSGGGTRTATTGLHIWDFTITMAPDQTVLRGATTGNYTVSVAALGSGAPASIPVSLAGAPSDATVLGFPATLPMGGSSNFTIQTGATSLGTFPLTATGTASGATRTATANLNIFDFTISLPPDQTVLRGTATGNYTVSVAALGVGAPANVPLVLSGAPSDATVVGFPATLPVGGSANFTVQTGATSLGTFPLTATGTASGATRTATANLNIFDFTVSLAPDQTVLRGTATGNYTVSVAAVGAGAPANVALALSGAPSDATVVGFPATLAVGGSSNFTIQTGATSLGDFTLTATGTASGATRTASTGLHIWDFTITMAPDQTVLRGTATGNYSVSVAALGSGAPASVAVALAGAPSDATVVGFPATLAMGSGSNFTIQTGATSLGSFPLTATGTAGGASRTATAALRIWDFTISLAPDRTVLRGTLTPAYTVSVAALGAGAPANAAVALSGLPSDASAIGLPATLAMGGSANFTIQTGATSLGTFPLTATGTAGGATRTANANLNIFDFTISLSPDRTVLRGTATPAYTVSVAGLGTGAPANVALALTGLPSDASAIGFPASLAMGGSSNFTVQTGATSLGNFPLTATGTAGGGTRTATAALRIYDYTLSLSPSVTTIARGCSTSLTLTAALVSGSTTNGLPSTLAVSLGGMPSGATANFPVSIGFPQSSGSPVTASFNVTTTSATALGSFSLNATGTLGPRTSSTAVLNIYDYTITLTPATLQLGQNQMGSMVVKLTLAAGSPAAPAINLSVSGPSPAGTIIAVLGATSLVPSPAGATTLLTVGPKAPATSMPKGTFTFTLTGSDGSSCPKLVTATVNVVGAMIGDEMRNTNCMPTPNGNDVVFSSGKITSTNPGGNMYNIAIKNTSNVASNVGFTINLGPNDTDPMNQDRTLLPSGASAFKLYGSRPVHIYTGDPCDCNTNVTDITPSNIQINTTGGVKYQPLSTNSTLVYSSASITVPPMSIPAGGTIWVQVHLRYALIGTSNWPSNSSTTFLRDYQFKTTFTGGLGMSTPAMLTHVMAGKSLTGVGGEVSDVNEAPKANYRVVVKPTSTCASPDDITDLDGFFSIPLTAGSYSSVKLYDPSCNLVGQQTLGSVSSGMFVMKNFTNIP